MSAIDVAEAPYMVGTKPPPKRAPLLLRQNVGDNPFERLPLIAFEQPVWKVSRFSNTWMINDPAGLKRVLLDNVANYPKTDLEQRFFRALFGDGLLSAEPDKWRAHRRLMAPSFSPPSVASYAPAMVECSVEMADAWSTLREGAEIDVSNEMTNVTLQIICRAMFGSDGGEMAQVTGSSLSRGADEAFNFGILDILPIIGPPRVRKKERMMGEIFAPLDGAIARLIEARKANPKPDLLGRLVAALDEETGAKLSPAEVRDEVLTIFVAGHETTASAMTFAFYVLSQRPDWERRLHAELAEVLGGRPPTEADLPKLTLTRRIIEETMRLYPPAPGLSARRAIAADEVAGVRIPKGAQIIVSSWVLHRHRALWDNPEHFDPDRFLPERSAGRHRFAYLPFGGGPRVCIGQAMAMTEAMLILATLAQRFRLHLRPGHQVAIQNRVTIRPRDGLPMTLERR